MVGFVCPGPRRTWKKIMQLFYWITWSDWMIASEDVGLKRRGIVRVLGGMVSANSQETSQIHN
jgi:hypothetical protein